ncbi:hypothetical protein K6119_02100 [Paracrocinitomix mangrovi]|uniref:DUF7793 family protein n=1 Tax=Paracrocinitomix mangrovi TaxID=2862509 RepID=UPI001C8E7214|nr:hypothetical protein [Paracrocinitomix mangrovi]UKN02311.1 hypothetical protein K6119_02100 [Paracrocinitomix mangrovi]
MALASTPVSEPLTFEKFSGCLLEDDIIYMRYFENQEIGEKEIELGFELHDILEVDSNVKRIIHCESYVSITRQARELVQLKGRPAKAEAYVIPALSQKILFTVYSKLRKRNHPLKAFDNLEDAVEWVNQF